MSEKESLLKAFKMPKQVNIAARSSSITNSFVNGIIPYIFPTELEVKSRFGRRVRLINREIRSL